jgi:regulator of protease activity HflC (stomatin/prohibitin superfamily)
MKKAISLTILMVVGLALFSGCASAPPLRTEASTSEISAAEEAGAADVPQASLHLQMAKEELELAKGLSAKGEKKKAASMLLRAEADAELAVALSRGDAEKSEARAAVERVHQLRQDNP